MGLARRAGRLGNEGTMNGRIEGNLSDPAEATPFVETVEGFSESLFEILWRRRWTVLVAVIVAMAAGLIYLHAPRPCTPARRGCTSSRPDRRCGKRTPPAS